MGLYAVTAGGVNDWNSKYAELFKALDVVILNDNDDPGRQLAKHIKKDIKNYVNSVRVIELSTIEKGDVTDWIEKENGNFADLMSKINESEIEYANFFTVDEKGKKRLNPDLLQHHISQVMKCIVVRQLGADFEQLYIYNNGIYQKQSRNDMKGTLKSYLKVGTASDNVLNNSYNLMLAGSPKKNIDEMDSNKNLIAFENGIYNTKTKKFEKFNYKYYITRKIHANYNEETTEPKLWMSFINDLCSNDSELINLLQEIMGILISNIDISEIKKCFMLYSPLGNTGKSVFLRIVTALVGSENVINIPLQRLSDRFALSDLYSKRLNIVGDQTAEEIEDSSGFKQLTGGDSVKVEFKGKQSFEWTFRGGILIACNSLPYFKDDKGGHMFERLCVIPCDNVIDEKDRDVNLTEKLLKELDGIVLWALKGLERFEENGLSKSKRADETVQVFRQKSDTVFNYVSESYIMTKNKSDRVAKTEFETEYKNWCSDNGYAEVKQRNIKDRMIICGFTCIKSCGNWYYTGLKKAEFKKVDVPDNEVPF